MTDSNQKYRLTSKYQATSDEIANLMKRAEGHPLGKGFLVDGALDSVAATFGVHAFVVDAARESLKEPQIAEPKLDLLHASAMPK